MGLHLRQALLVLFRRVFPRQMDAGNLRGFDAPNAPTDSTAVGVGAFSRVLGWQRRLRIHASEIFRRDARGLRTVGESACRRKSRGQISESRFRRAVHFTCAHE